MPRGVFERRLRPLVDRLIDKIVVERDGCWTWTGAKNEAGYGRIGAGPRGMGVLMAHRVAYEWIVGPIEAGLQIDHLCRNRSCVNPTHLEPVTSRENTRRGLRGSLVTHCPHGHAYDEENTTYGDKGGRVCLTCARERARAYRTRKRLERAAAA